MYSSMPLQHHPPALDVFLPVVQRLHPADKASPFAHKLFDIVRLRLCALQNIRIQPKCYIDVGICVRHCSASREQPRQVPLTVCRKLMSGSAKPHHGLVVQHDVHPLADDGLNSVHQPCIGAGGWQVAVLMRRVR